MVLNQRILLLLLVMVVFVFPAQGVCSDEKKWKDTAELAFVRTDGNTDVVSLAAKNVLKYRLSDHWAFQWQAAVLFARSDSEKSAERYATDLRADFTASDRLYYYGLAGWMQDKFAGLDQRYFGGPGVGYRILTGKRHQLSAELGAHYAKEHYIDKTASDFVEGRAYAKYQFQFSDTVAFSQELEYLQNFNHTQKYNLISISALQTKLNDWLALRVAYEIRYDNKPTPAALDNTDTLLTVSLVLNF